MSNTEAIQNADYLLEKIIKEQPNFLAPNVLNTDSGKAVGNFVTAFRNQLIAMYQEKPHQ